jgi:hypothetical protein
MDKKRVAILTILVVLVGSIFIVAGIRLIFGGDENFWLCDNGQWVKHGNPSTIVPVGGCGNTTSSDLTAQWKTYSNSQYLFEIKHPQNWVQETSGPFQATSQKIYEILLTQPVKNSDNNASKAIYWTIDVWKLTATNSQIAGDSGLAKFDVKDFSYNSASVIQSSQPSAISNKTIDYRLFVIQGNKYIYSLKSNVCGIETDLDCTGILSSFKIIK